MQQRRHWLKVVGRWFIENVAWNILASGGIGKAVIAVVISVGSTIWAAVEGVPNWSLFPIAVFTFGAIVFTWNQVSSRLDRIRLNRAIAAPQATTFGGLQIPARRVATLIDLSKSPYTRDRAIRIADLTQNTATITNRVFENCTIIGPAVFALRGRTSMSDCSFEGPKERLWIDVPKGFRPAGVVWVVNCIFRECHLSGIGQIGDADMKAKFEAGVREVR
jgi:hypothetical protein